MKLNATSYLSIAAFSLMGAGATQAALVSFTPDTLAEFQVNGTLIYQLNSSTASSTITVDGSGFEATNIMSATDRVTFTHDLIGSTINTATQLVTSIDISVDVADPGFGNSDTPIFFGIKQGGNTYMYSENNTVMSSFFRNGGSTALATFAKTGLTAADFDLFTGTSETGVTSTSNPDFVSGGNMQFVIGTFGATGAGTLQRRSDFDNMQIDVTFTPVPEPSSTALLGLGGLALILRRRK